MKKTLMAFVILAICSTSAVAQEKVKVAVSPFEPCIIKTQDGYTGHDIELWEMVARDAGIEYEYVETKFSNIFDVLQKGEADVAVAGITMTASREEIVDFSNHYLDSGLRILVNDGGNKSLLKTIQGIFTPELQKILVLLLMFVVVAGHIVWWCERGKDSINDKYFPGIFEAFYWAVVTVSTVGYGDIAPKNWGGRIVTSFIILTGLAIFGMYVGEVSSSMTLNKMESSISGYQDLKGKDVATLKGTTSVDILKDIGVNVIQVDSMVSAVQLLKNKGIDAVVFDSPSILYHAGKSNNVLSVGKLFDKQYYAFAFPQGSLLRERTNRSLLKVKQSSEYKSIYKKWFGEE